MEAHPHFIHVDNTNKDALRAPVSKNRVCFSELNAISLGNVVRNYSIKFTLEGLEYYTINKKEYKVGTNQFLTACAPLNGSAVIDSKSLVKGLCIDIDYDSIAEAYTVITANGKTNLENNLDHYFHSPGFFENIYPAQGSDLGRALVQISTSLSADKTRLSFIHKEFFLSLAEKVVLLECQNLKSISSLTSTRVSTRKEILRRLLLGKYFIDENFFRKIEVDEMARHACLSEFHFFRCFREAFGITPHQYLLRRRLARAHEALAGSKKPTGEIAEECGFTDIFSFSKSFKKFFGYSPSFLRDKTSQDLTN